MMKLHMYFGPGMDEHGILIEIVSSSNKIHINLRIDFSSCNRQSMLKDNVGQCFHASKYPRAEANTVRSDQGNSSARVHQSDQ